MMGATPEGKKNNPEERAEVLALNIKKFINCLQAPPDTMFLRKIDAWTPRDITAHLIGWNIYTLEGCRQIMKRETPAFFNDTGDDFSKVNDVLIHRYSSEDTGSLIDRMNTSAEELKEFASSIDRTEWQKDYGVAYKGGTVTLMNMIDALISDYEIHRLQIEKWAQETSV